MKNLALLLVTVFVSQAAFAEVVDVRKENQGNRIQQGVETNALNANETVRLKADQAKIESAEAAAKADGKVTDLEKAKLDRMQDRESRKIKRLKHNRR